MRSANSRCIGWGSAYRDGFVSALCRMIYWTQASESRFDNR
jgi:hypothetical protein